MFSHIVDSDNDGVGDSEDFLPLDSSPEIDSDGDGCGDNKTGTNGDQFPDDSRECSDQDLDGVGDNSDHPTDANESMIVIMTELEIMPMYSQQMPMNL